MSSDHYFKRFGFCEQQIVSPPSRKLGVVVVVPCFNEPELLGSLESLWACDRPGCAVEVIVVVNSPGNCLEDIRLLNQQTFEQASAWAAHHSDPRFATHVLHFPELPVKRAGVGLARKIGMDEAVRRLEASERSEGIIVGYDADCRCDANYLTSIERHFQQNPRSPGCSVYFEHPLEGPLNPRVYQAIAAYELHLRYYVQALRHAGFPYAYHTVGSCLAVRSLDYMRQGGMNKRQAGEDFYFLQKIIPLGGFTDLTETRVIPSPRGSDRVPFGTGRAVLNSLNGEQIGTYPLEAFLDLKKLFALIPALHAGGGDWTGLADGGLTEPLRDFLETKHFATALAEIRENTSTEAAFRKRFFHWFNAFLVMKFLHHAQDHFYGQREAAVESRKLLRCLSGVATPRDNASVRELLEIYRVLDRSVPSPEPDS